MAASGRYLFGDSTPFPLNQNFLDLLQAATDSCVALLAADARVEKARHATVVASTRADEDLRQIELLFTAVDQALVTFLPEDQAQTVCEETAQRLHKGTRTAFEQVRQQVTAWRDAAIHRAEQSVGRDRLLGSLVSLLVHHELPESTWAVSWQARSEELVEAQAVVTTALGLRAQLEIGVASDTPWARPVRVSTLVAALPLHVPKSGGWFRSTHLATEHLEKYLLAAVQTGGTSRTMRLCKTMKEGAPAVEFYLPEDPAGAITLRHFEVGGPVEGDREPVDPGDGPGLNLLWEAVAKPVLGLAAQRRRLIEAWFRDTPVAHLPRPGVVSEAIIATLAPLVRELRGRSSASGELNLKVEVQDGKREEIFIREDLVTSKWTELPDPQRQVFEAFGFGEERALEVDAIVESRDADEFSIEPVSNPEFDYEPMSNPDFHYQPVSDAELGVEPMSDDEALRVDPLTDIGMEAAAHPPAGLDYHIQADLAATDLENNPSGQQDVPLQAPGEEQPAAAAGSEPGEFVAISDVVSLPEEDVQQIEDDEPVPPPGPRTPPEA
ncbi:MAG: hypothetical protein ABIJ09_22505 [Pseudomonadota bacterium]